MFGRSFLQRERETKEEEGEKRQMIKFEFVNAVVVSTKIVTRVANEACSLFFFFLIKTKLVVLWTKRQGFLFTWLEIALSHPHFVVFSS